MEGHLLNDISSSLKHSSVIYLNFQDGLANTANGRKDSRCITAANSADIAGALIDGNFNEELYHYINVLRISVPSLKERAGDISILARHFLQEYSKEYNAQARSFTKEVLQTLTRHHWPGNVREPCTKFKEFVLNADIMIRK